MNPIFMHCELSEKLKEKKVAPRAHCLISFVPRYSVKYLPCIFPGQTHPRFIARANPRDVETEPNATEGTGGLREYDKTSKG